LAACRACWLARLPALSCISTVLHCESSRCRGEKYGYEPCLFLVSWGCSGSLGLLQLLQRPIFPSTRRTSTHAVRVCGLKDEHGPPAGLPAPGRAAMCGVADRLLHLSHSYSALVPMLLPVRSRAVAAAAAGLVPGLQLLLCLQRTTGLAAATAATLPLRAGKGRTRRAVHTTKENTIQQTTICGSSSSLPPFCSALASPSPVASPRPAASPAPSVQLWPLASSCSPCWPEPLSPAQTIQCFLELVPAEGEEQPGSPGPALPRYSRGAILLLQSDRPSVAPLTRAAQALAHRWHMPLYQHDNLKTVGKARRRRSRLNEPDSPSSTLSDLAEPDRPQWLLVIQEDSLAACAVH